jgi:uncharacterized protein (TIGR02646 family)
LLYIKKDHEPEALIQAKREGLRHYDDMTTEVKDIVKDSLSAEQGGLCAYCMRRLRPDMQIEHYTPRSISDDATTIDYRNLLGVCPGNKGAAEKFQTCDAHRGNTPLTVDPLKLASVALVRYLPNGTIYSDDEDVNHDLQITLNLNCKQAYLPQGRMAALNGLKQTIHSDCAGKTASKAYIQHLYDTLSQGKNGLLDEYLGILLSYLVKRGAVPPHK